MKKLLISNILFVILVMLYWQFNGSMMSFIYFNPTQSFFTRSDFLLFFAIGFGIFILIAFIFKAVYSRIQNNSYKRVIDTELLILYVIGFVSAIAYTYVVFFPSVQSIMIFIFVHTYKVLVVWYLLELVVFLLLTVLSVKKLYFVKTK